MKILMTGNALAGNSVTIQIEKLLSKEFSTAVGKIIIVHPPKEDLAGLIARMHEINPKLEIILVDDLSAHKDVLITNGTNNAEFARSFELKNVEVMKEPIIVHDKKMQFGENYRREQRYRSDRHNFNAKSYRR